MEDHQSFVFDEQNPYVLNVRFSNFKLFQFLASCVIGPHFDVADHALEYLDIIINKYKLQVKRHMVQDILDFFDSQVLAPSQTLFKSIFEKRLRNEVGENSSESFNIIT